MYQFDAHNSQKELLVDLLKPNGAFPASVFVTDSVSPGYGSAFVTYALQSLLAEPEHAHKLRLVRVSPVSSPTIAMLSSTIYRQLGQPPSGARADAARLVAGLTSAIQKGTRVQPGVKFVLLVENSERILDYWSPELLEVLLRLDEYCSCRGRLCVLMQSALPWSRFRTLSGRSTSLVPLTIDLPALQSHDLAVFFERHMPATLEGANLPRDAATRYFAGYWKVAHDTFASEVRDLEELRTLVLATWPIFCLPLRQNPALGFEGLLAQRGIFSDALARLASRKLTPQAWLDAFEEGPVSAGAHDVIGDSSRPRKKTRRCGVTSQPFDDSQPSKLGAYILICAFLASYNPVRLDTRYFQQTDEDVVKSKRGRGGRRGGKADDDAGESLDRPQLQGPKSFPLERLLAIFESILTSEEPDGLVDDRLKGDPERWRVLARSAAVMTQINCLVGSGRVAQTSGAGSLDGMQYRVNVSYAYVRALSTSHGFDLGERLWNWK
ncbi:hypothetical protein K437DRAFT_273613 [Tilletiaria anomala UBC 951]|uniref:Origin recognition complex subunit 5 C-terminal domain-containing protein n=1 Tax=Tilletiaria anomala (strain ATCC 24038 / CBS 436.72 / UBC 951) TaxID=1037660 RepID=A0A066W1B0_TILAU|nr:uncharacterized protein K437DRAFT_273613 [Tilletiaria anomala UBC 951]KDN47757.1 hypothetical protein K437DRAFT_273613 [Tilletiaria anomala UBC 951]